MNHLIHIGTSERVLESPDSDRHFVVRIANPFSDLFLFLN